MKSMTTSCLKFSTASFCGKYQLSTFVLAEHEGGSLKPQSFSAIKAASSLGENNHVSMLLAGSGSSLQQAAAHAASCHPSISQVLLADSDIFIHSLAEPWAKLVHLVQQKGGYSHMVAASSSFGKNILPRAAALLDVSPITDVTGISESRLIVRPIYAGNALCTVRYTGSVPCMLTVRPASFPVESMSADSKSNAAPVEHVDLSSFGEDGIGKSRYISQSSQVSERPDLGNARVVITGWRALKSANNFKLIEKLAERLGAAVGATRAAVDGVTLHSSMQVADYGLVGDLFHVIPELLEKLPEKK
ncbi:hypothetical protein RJ639_043149 [Escallonia herrerae]|uniref:Electron transfer flavoprotein subunit alpha, mitochondrial n=1 Tax=Escallonia herrerae TaxID=1293975 RepID=A0AA89B464_9ASTE|nr:hypothetical protein RJ639_043149 [Escallonia herrerae]